MKNILKAYFTPLIQKTMQGLNPTSDSETFAQKNESFEKFAI